MNPVDSDLEEGEILDDSPSSPCIDKKHRELPRRYVVHEKPTSVQKHKRDCKYANHYHSKKLAKLKKSPKSKDYRRKHHKSTCVHERSRRTLDKSSTNVEKSFSKNSHSLPNYSLIDEIKESVKSNSIKKQSTKNVSKSETDKNKSDNLKAEICRKGINIQSKDISYDSECCKESSVKNANEVKELIDISSDSDTKNVYNSTSSSSPKEKNDDSEDEEELRRIALATCAKRKILTGSTENLSKNTDSKVVSSLEWSDINNVQLPHHEINTLASDNYEVVDMEVDEDIQASIEILNNSGKDQGSEFLGNLFVIDTKPSGDFKENIQENSLQEFKVHTSSDEDFEIDILRAELIESLYRKKSSQNECTEEEKPVVNKPQAPALKEKQVTPKEDSLRKKLIGKYKKLNANFYHKQLQHGKHILRRTIVNKAENSQSRRIIINKTEHLNCNSSKPPPPVEIKKPSERLVIALNEESSSEDSETENPVASIEALISDCRQKSDFTKKNQEDSTNVPKAVLCLSKAQQEEYSSLVKILAEKEKVQGPVDKFQPKNGSAQSLHVIKLLGQKMTGFKETLREKKEFMSYLSKEVTSKKQLYMKSKTAVEHLKSQLEAAEKRRKNNLCAWSKACSDFKNAKKTVSNLENQINQLEMFFSKSGTTDLQLPSLSTGNK